jgi:hypothetical protein
MLFRRSLAALLAISGCFALAASEATAQDWRPYRNERYGFTLEYPGDLFVSERAAEAGDGHVFSSSNDEARLLVGALPNDSGYTPATYQQYIARHSYPSYQVDYSRLGTTWFALSGEGEGRIFYEKVMFTCGGRLINSFAMIYPSAQRDIFDRVVERIEKSFRPVTACERASLDSFPPRQQPAMSGPRVYGQRSALVDRIARARGHDVIVILRRTTPPYDRKVLRGYASRR